MGGEGRLLPECHHAEVEVAGPLLLSENTCQGNHSGLAGQARPTSPASSGHTKS